ncbi:MAG: tRNA epoxyqueuosine(34) reductase QueG [Phenylobacterium zucineum]|nr:MAG: tRNA epoxyqueuosine(34) reductase QueG [Phenylobacterium zucineum]
MTISISDPRSAIRLKAEDLGFDVCGFAAVDSSWTAGDHLATFVAAGRHGDMDWLATTLSRRIHPGALWPDTRSAIMLGVNYGPDLDPLEVLRDRARAAISVYAQGDDYHDLIKGRLKQLGGWMAGRFGQDLKVFVDTAPLMEKPLAQAAGLGWQGKHTNLVSREFGSWLFLGAILTTADLVPDETSSDRCGQCRACLDICPTGAFPAPYQLDARRCISYLTIELKGPIPREFRRALGNRIYGCDDCLAVCPWNKFAKASSEIRLQARPALAQARLEDLVGLTEPDFRALFAKSPIKRIGRDRFIRNVLYALGNTQDDRHVASITALLEDPAPLVRGAAVWALKQILDDASFKTLRAARPEQDADLNVRAEWN